MEESKKEMDEIFNRIKKSFDKINVIIEEAAKNEDMEERSFKKTEESVDNKKRLDVYSSNLLRRNNVDNVTNNNDSRTDESFMFISMNMNAYPPLPFPFLLPSNRNYNRSRTTAASRRYENENYSNTIDAYPPYPSSLLPPNNNRDANNNNDSRSGRTLGLNRSGIQNPNSLVPSSLLLQINNNDNTNDNSNNNENRFLRTWGLNGNENYDNTNSAIFPPNPSSSSLPPNNNEHLNRISRGILTPIGHGNNYSNMNPLNPPNPSSFLLRPRNNNDSRSGRTSRIHGIGNSSDISPVNPPPYSLPNNNSSSRINRSSRTHSRVNGNRNPRNTNEDAGRNLYEEEYSPFISRIRNEIISWNSHRPTIIEDQLRELLLHLRAQAYILVHERVAREIAELCRESQSHRPKERTALHNLARMLTINSEGNDDQVRQVTLHTVLKKKAYMIFYVRLTTNIPNNPATSNNKMPQINVSLKNEISTVVSQQQPFHQGNTFHQPVRHNRVINLSRHITQTQSHSNSQAQALAQSQSQTRTQVNLVMNEEELNPSLGTHIASNNNSTGTTSYSQQPSNTKRHSDSGRDSEPDSHTDRKTSTNLKRKASTEPRSLKALFSSQPEPDMKKPKLNDNTKH